MILKLVTYAASVVTQNRKDCFPVLDERAYSKSNDVVHQPDFQEYHLHACYMIERPLRTEQSSPTLGDVARFRKNQYRLLLGNCSRHYSSTGFVLACC